MKNIIFAKQTKIIMRKSVCIKIFYFSSAIVVPLTVGLLADDDYRHGLMMVVLLVLALRGLLKVVKQA